MLLRFAMAVPSRARALLYDESTSLLSLLRALSSNDVGARTGERGLRAARSIVRFVAMSDELLKERVNTSKYARIVLNDCDWKANVDGHDCAGKSEPRLMRPSRPVLTLKW